MTKINIRIDKIQEGKFCGYMVVPSVKATEITEDKSLLMAQIIGDFVKEDGEGEDRYFDYLEAVQTKEILTRRLEEAGFEVIDEIIE